MLKSLHRQHNQVFLELLRRRREIGKLRQADLALYLGSDQATVSKVETGGRRLDVIELRDWLLALDVDFLDFMHELDDQLCSQPTLDQRLATMRPRLTRSRPKEQKES